MADAIYWRDPLRDELYQVGQEIQGINSDMAATVFEAVDALKVAQEKIAEPVEEMAELEDRCDRYKAALGGLQQIVDEQAEVEGLWFVALRITEAHLQSELRRLHEAVELASKALTGQEEG